jgi:hypothetical protein
LTEHAATAKVSAMLALPPRRLPSAGPPRLVLTLLALALTLALAAPPARAQVLIGYLFGEKLASPTFNLGFEIGLNFSTLDGFDDATHIRPPVFGLCADWRFSEHVHFGGALLPFAGRGAEGLAPAPTGDPAFDAQITNATMKRSLGVVEVPLILKWAPRREEGVRVGAGLSLGFVSGATDRYEATSPEGLPYVLERELQDRVPGIDVGLSTEVEWRFELLGIAARYTHGLTDMREDGAPEAAHTRVLTGTGRIYLGKQPAGQ